MDHRHARKLRLHKYTQKLNYTLRGVSRYRSVSWVTAKTVSLHIVCKYNQATVYSFAHYHYWYIILTASQTLFNISLIVSIKQPHCSQSYFVCSIYIFRQTLFSRKISLTKPIICFEYMLNYIYLFNVSYVILLSYVVSSIHNIFLMWIFILWFLIVFAAHFRFPWVLHSCSIISRRSIMLIRTLICVCPHTHATTHGRALRWPINVPCSGGMRVNLWACACMLYKRL